MKFSIKITRPAPSLCVFPPTSVAASAGAGMGLWLSSLVPSRKPTQEDERAASQYARIRAADAAQRRHGDFVRSAAGQAAMADARSRSKAEVATIADAKKWETPANDRPVLRDLRWQIGGEVQLTPSGWQIGGGIQLRPRAEGSRDLHP